MFSTFKYGPRDQTWLKLTLSHHSLNCAHKFLREKSEISALVILEITQYNKFSMLFYLSKNGIAFGNYHSKIGAHSLRSHMCITINYLKLYFFPKTFKVGVLILILNVVSMNNASWCCIKFITVGFKIHTFVTTSFLM